VAGVAGVGVVAGVLRSDVVQTASTDLDQNISTKLTPHNAIPPLTVTGGYPEPTISVTDDVPASLSCTSLGGYPPPSIEVYVGLKDITSTMMFRSVVNVTGQKGLR